MTMCGADTVLMEEITSPLKTDGDKWNIEDFLRDIKNLKAKEFIEDDAKDLSKYGLDKPSIKIELWLGKDMAYKGVNFGKTEEDIVYACRAGLNTVYGLDKDKAETSETYENVPIFYHCFPDVEKRDNGALEGASSAFAKNIQG